MTQQSKPKRKSKTAKTREIAQLLCRCNPTNDCVMDEDGRTPCTKANCRMMRISDWAVSMALLRNPMPPRR